MWSLCRGQIWAKFERMGKFENMYADEVNFTELNLEIAKFNRLVQWSATCGPFSNFSWAAGYFVLQSL